MKYSILAITLLCSFSLYSMDFKKCDIKVKIENQRKSIFSKKWKTKNTFNQNPCWIGSMDVVLRDEVGQLSSSSCGTNINGVEYSVDIENTKLEDGQFNIKLILGNNDFGTDLASNTITLDQRVISTSDNYTVTSVANFIINQENRKRSAITNVSINCVND